MSTAESWPSLYNWAIEVFPLQSREPVQPAGVYLYDRHTIYKFTLYWTLVFYAPAYILCAFLAFFNLMFPPTRPLTPHKRTSFPLQLTSSYFGVPQTNNAGEIPLAPYSASPLPDERDLNTADTLQYRARAIPNEKRSRLTVALLVFLAFVIFSVAGAVVGSAIIGYVLAGLFKAGHFNMST
ncbi:hypothetical protein WOLCODRAFT_76976 [Wolfiporia cocos MD-104 SS10]|uniref:Uncharacterized protein n=1 Tax=Wolfiporia cocos (strain MD-104) TaxID=742152 RepID=A0A2H3JQP6_WOLCO|nr:hypothetical protein WOLCODRAFT_76976 [Wolfiporia cocos MD-104 SS10]